MTCALFKLDFEEKTQLFFLKTWVLKKKTWVLKKKPEFWKNLSFLKKLMSKGKTWALTKENIVGMKIEPQT